MFSVFVAEPNFALFGTQVRILIKYLTDSLFLILIRLGIRNLREKKIQSSQKVSTIEAKIYFQVIKREEQNRSDRKSSYNIK